MNNMKLDGSERRKLSASIEGSEKSAARSESKFTPVSASGEKKPRGRKRALSSKKVQFDESLSASYNPLEPLDYQTMKVSNERPKVESKYLEKKMNSNTDSSPRNIPVKKLYGDLKSNSTENLKLPGNEQI